MQSLIAMSRGYPWATLDLANDVAMSSGYQMDLKPILFPNDFKPMPNQTISNLSNHQEDIDERSTLTNLYYHQPS
ncbi:hypothetical protein JTE90_021074 [Oedothorax gibbosus]|uniref:Uncharacterized protein n=1 Tax=Oedothorax gibbosus TaxID=931172 RepID=A0AAV6VQG8_9ARAC|nr:hypothetical protein JTE90_021074 [Oedothorax gibbosus]